MVEPSHPSALWREQGLEFLRAGEDARAIDLFTRAVLADECDAEAKGCLGIAYSRKGLHEPAIRLLREAINLAPESPNLRYNLGVALDRAGQLEMAREALLTTLQLAPEHAQAQRRLASLSAPDPPGHPETGCPEEEKPAPEITAPGPQPLPPYSVATGWLAESPAGSLPAPFPGRLTGSQQINPNRSLPLTRHRAGTIGAIGITGYLLLPLGLGCSLLTLVSLALGFSAWSMAHRDLAQMDAGRMDSSGWNSTVRGRRSGIVLVILSLASFLVSLLLLFALFASGRLQGTGRL